LNFGAILDKLFQFSITQTLQLNNMNIFQKEPVSNKFLKPNMVKTVLVQKARQNSNSFFVLCAWSWYVPIQKTRGSSKIMKLTSSKSPPKFKSHYYELRPFLNARQSSNNYLWIFKLFKLSCLTQEIQIYFQDLTR
jgi:hypothetical protein